MLSPDTGMTLAQLAEVASRAQYPGREDVAADYFGGSEATRTRGGFRLPSK